MNARLIRNTIIRAKSFNSVVAINPLRAAAVSVTMIIASPSFDWRESNDLVMGQDSFF